VATTGDTLVAAAAAVVTMFNFSVSCECMFFVPVLCTTGQAAWVNTKYYVDAVCLKH